ncbi:MAG: hypothetical protein SWH68_05220 [Thermodesulfobacteriota bacterium]|nr:hypothetical protein [Thermodesulfobacteriota bacterium]
MEELERFLAHPVVETVPMTEITSDRYSRIAAQTMETGAELITMDHHFQNICNLVFRLFSPPQSSNF